MSVSRWIAFVTKEELAEAEEKSNHYVADFWFHNLNASCYFDFGDANDLLKIKATDELEEFNPALDQVANLLEVMFMATCEYENIEKFKEFIAANLGKNKMVKFWYE